MEKPDDTPAQAETADVKPKMGRMVKTQKQQEEAAEAKASAPKPLPDYPVVATRDAMAALRPSTIKVPIESCEASIYIRTISGREREELMDYAARLQEDDEAVGGEVRATHAVRYLSDADGNRLYTDDQIPEVAALPGTLLEIAYQRGIAHNCLMQVDIDALVGNSDAATSGDSGSD